MLVSGDRIIRAVEHVLRDRKRPVVGPAQPVGSSSDGPG
jgi:hypothetical protein